MLTEMNSLSCMNCKIPVRSGAGEFFGQVFVCSACFDVAEHFYERLQRELGQLLTLGKEAIRVALVEGRFHLATRGAGDISKRELLEEILRLDQARERRSGSERES